VPSTNATFFLNTSHVTKAQAEQACVTNGGHLAVFSTLGEQVCTRARLLATVSWRKSPVPCCWLHAAAATT
jgi:hypothetical protein